MIKNRFSFFNYFSNEKDEILSYTKGIISSPWLLTSPHLPFFITGLESFISPTTGGKSPTPCALLVNAPKRTIKIVNFIFLTLKYFYFFLAKIFDQR